MGQNKAHFLAQEKLTYSHNKTIFLVEQGDFFGILGQEKSILGLIKMNYGT
jgi:hypothetical protein